ncbi:DNA-binding transcriptional regulator, LysR family [Micromonospora phaseoli]|uniref:DNA-binding transcriptional regulator, LysR family n=1 Tax=Micromonospora phaseoli TaxID=1144548 RepID=A0A1H7BTC4_9ACTN|nr:LysR family transcriptional regulator [Micromonospora phaseoli]PZV92840.1 DNA-binding transcriptional LysR family regulator [Micromonospora phaseoli]SEJ80923.1 DNA-binding transcriptional regulator, LysR family [Micromonospora phaseoli]
MRLFLILAEELHFGRAAQRAFLTQPTLSQQIRALEDRLGVDLVQRSSRQIDLTEAGRALVPQARRLVTAMADLQAVADVHARRLHGCLRVGAIGGEAFMPYVIDILAELSARHPGVDVEIRSVNLVEQVHALPRGEIDAAFLRPPLPAGFRGLHLSTEPRVACLPADDPLVDRAPLTLADLSDHLVVDVPIPELRAWWDFWTVNPRPDGSPVRYGPVAGDMDALLSAVARGQAIAFLPAEARRDYSRRGVAYVDVIDLPHSTAALAWLPNSDNPLLTALLHAARSVLQRKTYGLDRPSNPEQPEEGSAPEADRHRTASSPTRSSADSVTTRGATGQMWTEKPPPL